MAAAATALYEPPVPQSLIDAFGGTADDYISEVELWPCFYDLFSLFTNLDTQWRMGFGGRTGLDYAILPMMFKTFGLKWSREALEDLQVMETAALQEIYRKKPGDDD